MTFGTTPHSESATGQPDDSIMVPRGVLVHILTHLVAGHKRFPTRHLSQAIQQLHHVLGITM